MVPQSLHLVYGDKKLILTGERFPGSNSRMLYKVCQFFLLFSLGKRVRNVAILEQSPCMECCSCCIEAAVSTRYMFSIS